MKAPNIRDFPGWHGAFTDEQAPEARFKNGARVEKDVCEAGDATPVGTMGTVLGSVYVPGSGTAYFIEWDNRPRWAVFVVEVKLK
jgi:hypothetical protein